VLGAQISPGDGADNVIAVFCFGLILLNAAAYDDI
jgi:hypothetical protein